MLRHSDGDAVLIVADAIRARIDWRGPLGDDHAFLQSYYTAPGRRLEGRRLFGRRKVHKPQRVG